MSFVTYIAVSLIISLLLTLIIETFTSVFLGIREKRDIGIVIIANIITNPIVVYISNCLNIFTSKSVFYVGVLILEVLAIIVEFWIFKKYLKYNKKSPFIISLINNFVSYNLGNIINLIFFL